MLKMKKLRSVSLETMIDKHFGKIGSASRDMFEQALRLDLEADKIKQVKKQTKSK